MSNDTEAPLLDKVEAIFKVENNGAGVWEEWEVLEFRIRESLTEPYFGFVEVARKVKEVDFSKWLGKSCVLVLTRGGGRRRLFKGLVFTVERLKGGEGFMTAQIEFGAALVALRDGIESRVFENQTAAEIIEEVLKEGLQDYHRKVRMSLRRPYARREYCAQWNESDMNFVLRLMVEEGISFHFDQGEHETRDKETVVVVDSNDAYVEIETMKWLEVG